MNCLKTKVNGALTQANQLGSQHSTLAKNKQLHLLVEDIARCSLSYWKLTQTDNEHDLPTYLKQENRGKGNSITATPMPVGCLRIEESSHQVGVGVVEDEEEDDDDDEEDDEDEE